MAPPFDEASQRTIAPVPPDVVRVPEFEPLHTSLVGSDGLSKVTATVVALTVTFIESANERVQFGDEPVVDILVKRTTTVPAVGKVN